MRAIAKNLAAVFGEKLHIYAKQTKPRFKGHNEKTRFITSAVIISRHRAALSASRLRFIMLCDNGQ
jgi:hypothetical protein